VLDDTHQGAMLEG